ncbi:uncharacterized protein AKAME5_002698100, partial [Lates japonicus]
MLQRTLQSIAVALVLAFPAWKYHYQKDEKLDHHQINSLFQKQPLTKLKEQEKSFTAVMERKDLKNVMDDLEPQPQKNPSKPNTKERVTFEPVLNSLTDVAEFISTVSHHMCSAGSLTDLAISAIMAVYLWYKWKREKTALVSKNTQLQNESVQKEREKEDVVATLMEVKAELENQRAQLQVLLEEVERDWEENKLRLQSVEKEITEREMTFDKPEELLREKEMLLGAQWKLDRTKKNTERQLLNSERLMEPIDIQLEPPTNAVQMTIEWGRNDLNPRFVYVWHDGHELLTDQNEAYTGRASLDINKLKQGDISLRLSTVKVSDNGTYRCYLPKQSQEYFIDLVVGAVSSPTISLAGLDKSISAVVLECESKGWCQGLRCCRQTVRGPLSAGPTETVRSDDLYAVRGDCGERDTATASPVEVNRTTSTRPQGGGIPSCFESVSSSSTASQSPQTSTPDRQEVPTTSRAVLDQVNLSRNSVRLRKKSKEMVNIEFHTTSSKYKFPVSTKEAGNMVTFRGSDGSRFQVAEMTILQRRSPGKNLKTPLE